MNFSRAALIFTFTGLLVSCSNKSDKCMPHNQTLALSGENVDIAMSIADRWISLHPADEMAWNWGETVLMYGITRLYEYTGNQDYQRYIKEWVDYNIDKGYYLFMSDSCAPGLIAVELYRQTCDEKYLQVIKDIYTYLTEEAPRTPEGGISHLGILAPSSPQLWIDSLFMFGMPMIKAGEITGDRKYLDLIEDQMIIFADILQDKNTGLFRHAYINGKTVPEEPVFWARGNAWVLASSTELLNIMGEGDKKERIKNIQTNLLTAVINFQDNVTGLWRTVLNRPETYFETSASALFTYSILKGINDGILDNVYLSYAEKGIAGIKSKIRYDSGFPVVTDISAGTNPGDFENYNNVELKDDISYGVGAVILALMEYEKISGGAQ